MSLDTTARDRLRSFVERIENLEAEKAGLAADVKDLMTTAKGEGFDPKIIRKVIAKRKMSKQEREEEDAILDTYLHALGMAGTPLAEWADSKEVEKV